jgi:hypothetical protein
MTSKSCDIPKNVVVEVWKHVRANRGAEVPGLMVNP